MRVFRDLVVVEFIRNSIRGSAGVVTVRCRTLDTEVILFNYGQVYFSLVLTTELARAH